MPNPRAAPTVLAVVAFACCAAALVVFPLILLVASGLAALTGLFVFAVARGPLDSRSPKHRRRAITAGRDAAGSVAATVLIITGAEVALGPATVPVVLLAAAAATPWVWQRRAQLLERYRPGPTGHRPTSNEHSGRSRATDLAEGSSPGDLVSLPTSALCARWQAGYHALQRNPGPHLLDLILHSRRGCLEELESRDPAGVARWLATESRPGSTSPHRYLACHSLTDHSDAPGSPAVGKPDDPPPDRRSSPETDGQPNSSGQPPGSAAVGESDPDQSC